MLAAPGTHDTSMSMLMRHIHPTGRVLDLAAGSGAWLARLRDAGFTDQTAVELDHDRFRLQGVEAIAIDLNSAFADMIDAPFHIVTAIEIIEHLDCPRHFLRQVHDLLADGGYVLLSTPNLGNWTGRIRFLLQAEHRYFKVSDYHEQRHISPITHNHMQLMLEEIGFKLIDYTTAGSFFGVAKRLLTAPVSVPFRLAFGTAVTGDVNIYLAVKVTTTTASKGKNSTYF